MSLFGRNRHRGRGGPAVAVLLAVAVATVALAGETAAAPGDILGTAKAAVCRYSAALLTQAYEIFRIQVGRAPADLPELYSRQFIRPPRCPAGGEYSFDADGQALCSVHDRPVLRVREMGVYRTVPRPGRLPLSELAFHAGKDERAVFYAHWSPDGRSHDVQIQWLGPDGSTVQVDRLAVKGKSEVSATLPLRFRGQRLPTGEYQVSLVVDGR
ncbi:MAG: hypothetical protein ACM3UP_01365, partial [Methanocella sp.]